MHETTKNVEGSQISSRTVAGWSRHMVRRRAALRRLLEVGWTFASYEEVQMKLAELGYSASSRTTIGKDLRAVGARYVTRIELQE